jgi:hypothetical protein
MSLAFYLFIESLKKNMKKYIQKKPIFKKVTVEKYQ